MLIGVVFLLLGVFLLYGRARIGRFRPCDFPDVVSDGFERAKRLQLRVFDVGLAWCFGFVILSIVSLLTASQGLAQLKFSYLLLGLFVFIHYISKSDKLRKSVGITKWRKQK